MGGWVVRFEKGHGFIATGSPPNRIEHARGNVRASERTRATSSGANVASVGAARGRAKTFEADSFVLKSGLGLR